MLSLFFILSYFYFTVILFCFICSPLSTVPLERNQCYHHVIQSRAFSGFRCFPAGVANCHDESLLLVGWNVGVVFTFITVEVRLLLLIYFHCRKNHKLEVRFDLNMKPTTNDVNWRNFLIFLYFFVHLLRALPTFLFRRLFLFSYKNFFKTTLLFSYQISLRRFSMLCENPCARLSLSVSPV